MHIWILPCFLIGHHLPSLSATSLDFPHLSIPQRFLKNILSRTHSYFNSRSISSASNNSSDGTASDAVFLAFRFKVVSVKVECAGQSEYYA
ncbi:hypothetical protein F4815DRAFT_460384 [Daldinia loculata]|nr:hypothetical protein F4815DRAFT_460384 [Daldinia loculata]